MKIGDRVKILVRSYAKDQPDFVQWGTVYDFYIRDERQKQYNIPDTVGVVKDSVKPYISEYCLDTGYTYIWGQGISETSGWEKLDPQHLPIISVVSPQIFDKQNDKCGNSWTCDGCRKSEYSFQSHCPDGWHLFQKKKKKWWIFNHWVSIWLCVECCKDKVFIT